MAVARISTIGWPLVAEDSQRLSTHGWELGGAPAPVEPVLPLSATPTTAALGAALTTAALGAARTTSGLTVTRTTLGS